MLTESEYQEMLKQKKALIDKTWKGTTSQEERKEMLRMQREEIEYVNNTLTEDVDNIYLKLLSGKEAVLKVPKNLCHQDQQQIKRLTNFWTKLRRGVV